jgi:SSS family solute:Na+ symporter
VSPGILAMFLMGFFWKKTTSGAAMFATVGGLVGSVILKFLPQMADLSWMIPFGFAKATASGVVEIPFLDRMFIVFFVVVAGMVLISKLAEQRGYKEDKGLEIDAALFRVSPGFAAGAGVIGVILVAVYALWWW